MDLVQAVNMHEVMTGVNNPLALSLMAVMALCRLAGRNGRVALYQSAYADALSL